MTYGRKATRFGRTAPRDEAFDRLVEDVVVHACLVARLAAQQRIYRHAKMLAGDVPQRNVDGAERAHDRRAPKMSGAVHVLPVVLDAQRVLAHQVMSEFGDDLLGGLQKTPCACLSEPNDASVSVHLDKQISIDRQGFDARDLHDGLGYSGADSHNWVTKPCTTWHCFGRPEMVIVMHASQTRDPRVGARVLSNAVASWHSCMMT